MISFTMRYLLNTKCTLIISTFIHIICYHHKRGGADIKAEPAGSFHGNHTMMDDVNKYPHKTGKRNLPRKSGKFLESKRYLFSSKEVIHARLISNYINRPHCNIEIQYIYNIYPANSFIYLSICRIPWIKVTGYRGYLKKYYAPHP